MRTTQRKGDIATARAIAALTELGYDVAIPVTESAPYDLVADTPTGLMRIRCKFSSTPEVDLRRIHSNGQGYVEKRVEEGAYDWLYVLRPGGEEYLFLECHFGRRSITPRPENLIGAVAESGLLQLP